METTRGEVMTAAYTRVASLLFDTPLALTRDRGLQLRTYLIARMQGAKPEASITLADMERDPITIDMHADGVAQLGVRGTLTPKGSNMDALSGLVGYDALTAAFDALAADDAVRGVVVAMESPGGSVLGVDLAGNAMRALAAKKPVYLVADHLCASAAYWIGAQATRIYVADTSLVGSIGSYMMRLDSTVADEKAGSTVTIVSNMGRKGDGSQHKALTAEEEASMRAIVSQSDALFFAAVKQGRGLSAASIKKLDGDVLMGLAAIEAGLADAIGGVPEATAALRAALPPTTNTNGRRPATGSGARAEEGQRMSTETPTGAPSAEVIDITQHPDFQKAVDAAASSKSAAALEQDREIRGLCALFAIDAKRTEDIVASGKSRADIYATLQEARVAADEAGDTRGTHAGGPTGKSRGETQDTAAGVAAEYAERAKIHAEARREFFSGGRA